MAQLNPCLKAGTSALVVLKLGSQLLVEKQTGLAQTRLAHILQQVAQLNQQGHKVVVVTSGSIGLGQNRLGLTSPLTANQKRACAAVGQSLLMQAYSELLAGHGLKVAQVLLNSRHFSERWHYVTMKETLESLLELGVIPIINENDTLADPVIEAQTEEAKPWQTASFGDNDRLCALVALKLEADALVILSNVEGLYTANPQTHPQAKKLSLIEDWGALAVDTSGQSALGRGGMASKLEAARLASFCGLDVILASGLKQNTVLDSLYYQGESADFPGTLIRAAVQASYQGAGKNLKRWIGLASGYQGVLTINPCAVKALKTRTVSLLPVGIVAVDGEFQAGQVVSIQNEAAEELGRGVAAYSSAQLKLLAGHPSHQFEALLGTANPNPEAIHKDRLVVF